MDKVTQQNAASAEESRLRFRRDERPGRNDEGHGERSHGHGRRRSPKGCELARKVLGKKLAATGQFKKQAKKTSLQQDNSKDPGKLIPLEEATSRTSNLVSRR